MTTVEIIDKQIEEAANFLSYAKTMKNRDRDMDRAFAALLAMNGRLLEVAQNQQEQIRFLHDRCDTLRKRLDRRGND